MTIDESTLTAQGWRATPAGRWTHPMLVPTKGSTSRATLLTTAEALTTQAAWDSAAAQLADIAVETA